MSPYEGANRTVRCTKWGWFVGVRDRHYLLSRVAQHIRLAVDGDGIDADERLRTEVYELLAYTTGGDVRHFVGIENLKLYSAAAAAESAVRVTMGNHHAVPEYPDQNGAKRTDRGAHR